MPDGGTTVRNVAEALLAELARRGTRRIWGVPGGGSSLDILAGLGRFGLSFVLTKHEGAAGMAAIAEAELTGAPGVVLTTKGPGVGNALNGLACASLERAPVLLVSDGFTAAAGRLADAPGLRPSRRQRTLRRGLCTRRGRVAGRGHRGAS